MSHGYRFTDDEKLLLEAVFLYNTYPNRTTLHARPTVAKIFDVNVRNVCDWFVAKRID